MVFDITGRGGGVGGRIITCNGLRIGERNAAREHAGLCRLGNLGNNDDGVMALEDEWE